jgi:cyclopropane fatty-acyl-phospholipid synthase-like methyltransferase
LYFSLLYARRSDPWNYESSEYEHEKYKTTLAALGDKRLHRVLEIGCSVGVFTDMLADRSDHLLAIDVAPAAVARARTRLKDRESVQVRRAALPEWTPPGQFDAIVCSEVLYYLTPNALLRSFHSLERSLRPGGSLIAVHRRGKGRSAPLHGDRMHDLLIEHRTNMHAYSETHDRFRLDRFDAPSESLSSSPPRSRLVPPTRGRHTVIREVPRQREPGYTVAAPGAGQ